MCNVLKEPNATNEQAAIHHLKRCCGTTQVFTPWSAVKENGGLFCVAEVCVSSCPAQVGTHIVHDTECFTKISWMSNNQQEWQHKDNLQRLKTYRKEVFLESLKFRCKYLVLRDPLKGLERKQEFLLWSFINSWTTKSPTMLPLPTLSTGFLQPQHVYNNN